MSQKKRTLTERVKDLETQIFWVALSNACLWIITFLATVLPTLD